MKQIFDLLISFVAMFVLSAPMLMIALLVKLTSPGPVLYWSDRVGINNTIFRMPKFRTMRINTPAVATHLMKKAGISHRPTRTHTDWKYLTQAQRR